MAGPKNPFAAPHAVILMLLFSNLAFTIAVPDRTNVQISPVVERDIEETRPTYLPGVGWCGVPGAPCSASETSDDADVEERNEEATRPTTLPGTGWCGVPGAPCLVEVDKRDVEVARPTDLPGTGWCGVPGAPCMVEVDEVGKRDVRAAVEIREAPTPLATLGIPGEGESDPIPAATTADLTLHGNSIETATPTCAFSDSDKKTRCIKATRMPSEGPPTSLATSGAAAFALAHIGTAGFIAVLVGAVLSF